MIRFSVINEFIIIGQVAGLMTASVQTVMYAHLI
ncbi:MAG: hypothetical protein ACI8RO_002035 [Flavobacteriales bacterium]|jgi:hypothetical protein